MKTRILLACITLIGAASCIKHEVIPAPKPKVDLTTVFSADTNGATISYKSGIDGYAVISDNYREIKGSPLMSTIIYYNTLKSDSKVEQFKLSIGSAEWDAASGTFPPLENVSTFLSTSKTWVYSDGGTNGVELIWKDSDGVLWKTKDTSIATVPATFTLATVTQESDETGDYFKFQATFDCYLYNNTLTDSVHFENGTYTSYIKN